MANGNVLVVLLEISLPSHSWVIMVQKMSRILLLQQCKFTQEHNSWNIYVCAAKYH